jgi:hypothetical protein
MRILPASRHHSPLYFSDASGATGGGWMPEQLFNFKVM